MADFMEEAVQEGLKRMPHVIGMSDEEHEAAMREILTAALSALTKEGEQPRQADIVRAIEKISEAAYALAYEQYTANLIAAASNIDIAAGSDHDRLIARIKGRMGFGEQ